jgi:hypothetical protein
MIDGKLVCDGHTIEFSTNPDGETVRIYENYNASQKDSTTSHMKVSLKNATKYQEKYIKLGYDKVS